MREADATAQSSTSIALTRVAVAAEDRGDRRPSGRSACRAGGWRGVTARRRARSPICRARARRNIRALRFHSVSTVREIGLAGEPAVDDALGLLTPSPKRYWKIGIRRLPGLAARPRSRLVDLGERADQRLLADHVLAGARAPPSACGRCTTGGVQMSTMSIVRHRQQFVEVTCVRRSMPNSSPTACSRSALRSQSACTPERARRGAIALEDVAAADVQPTRRRRI